MKIISKFKDYYDIGLSYGYDDSIHYVRATEVFEDTVKNFGLEKGSYTHNDITIILFCGKSYFVKSDDKGSFITDYDEILDAISNGGNSGKYFRYYDSHRLDTLKSYLTESFILEKHLEYNSPIIAFNISGDRITIKKDPMLKTLGFFKFFDSASAFQELSMYMGSVLCDKSTPKMPVGGDMVILKSKGFDDKYGFRKRPKKKS